LIATVVESGIRFASRGVSIYRKRSMGQQHRVRAKRKRRKAYLRRRRASIKL